MAFRFLLQTVEHVATWRWCLEDSGTVLILRSSSPESTLTSNVVTITFPQFSQCQSSKHLVPGISVTNIPKFSEIDQGIIKVFSPSSGTGGISLPYFTAQWAMAEKMALIYEVSQEISGSSRPSQWLRSIFGVVSVRHWSGFVVQFGCWSTTAPPCHSESLLGVGVIYYQHIYIYIMHLCLYIYIYNVSLYCVYVLCTIQVYVYIYIHW